MAGGRVSCGRVLVWSSRHCPSIQRRSKRGGTAQGLFTMFEAFGNLSPSLLGFLYGGATAKGLKSVDALSDLLEVSVCAGYLLSALCFFAALQGDGGGLGAGGRYSAELVELVEQESR